MNGYDFADSSADLATIEDPEITKRIDKLFKRIQTEAPSLYEGEAAFYEQISGTYGRGNRVFHGRNHLLDMTEEGPHDLEEQQLIARLYQQAYGTVLPHEKLLTFSRENLLALLPHDDVYHVDGTIAEPEREHLKNLLNVDEKWNPVSFKENIEDDKVSKITLDLFGITPEQKFGFAPGGINQFNGQNEFLSALAYAKKLEASGEDLDTIVSITARIAATLAFKSNTEFRKLHQRIEDIYNNTEELREKYSDQNKRNQRIDLIGMGSAFVANKDILGFTGGLKPDQEPTVDAVVNNMIGADYLVAEEGSPALRAAKTPGDYKVYDLLAPTFKRSRVYELIIKKDAQNLFHSVKLHGDVEKGSTEVTYPPEDTVAKFNNLVRDNEGKLNGIGDIANEAYKARVIALSIVHAVEVTSGKNGTLKEWVEGLKEINFGKRSSIEEGHRLAISALKQRKHGLKFDTGNSPIAQALLKALDSDQIHTLYLAAEAQFGRDFKDTPGTPERSQAFLDAASKVIGDDKVQSFSQSLLRNFNRNTAQGHAEQVKLSPGFSRTFM